MNKPGGKMISNSKKQIITYLILVALFSTIVYALFLNGVLQSNFYLFIMWSPGFSAIITKLVFQKNLRNIGWGLGKTKYQIFSYFFPLFLGAVVYGIVWLIGLGGMSIEKFTTEVGQFFGMSETPSFIISFLLLAVVVFPNALVGAIGEEIGWRGLLVPELSKLTSFTKLSLFSGIIWAAWHVPGIIAMGYTSGISPWFTIPCFAVMVISASFVFAWIRLKSGSVWTAVILHATHNLFIQNFYDTLTIDTGSTLYFTTEFGIGMALIYSVAAYYFWRRRDEVEVK